MSRKAVAEVELWSSSNSSIAFSFFCRAQYLASPITDKDTVEGSGDLLSYGVSAHQGWRKNMEDAHLAAQLGHEIYLFGIFDGHGAGM